MDSGDEIMPITNMIEVTCVKCKKKNTKVNENYIGFIDLDNYVCMWCRHNVCSTCFRFDKGCICKTEGEKCLP